MKKIYLLAFLFLASLTMQAQRPEPRGPLRDHVHPGKDVREEGGYTIRLRQGADTYHYMLFRGNNIVSNKEHDPQMLMPLGFEKKADAFKAATWAIKEQRKTGHFPTFLPPHVAQELGIDLHPKPLKRN